MKTTGNDRKLKMKLRDKIEPEFARQGYFIVPLGITPVPASCLGEFGVYSQYGRDPSNPDSAGWKLIYLVDDKHCTQAPIFRFYSLQFQWGMLINEAHRVIQPEMYYYGDLRAFVDSLAIMELMEE